ncbi:Mini-ribonuclease 3 [Anaerovorax odorimutans]|uniref:Mini-ribonuclease 3 n=1 Tax=Anaerovorax odorimutans TaxID=109327 RepID=UPI00042602DF|nr:ribonuclease III domain-containing protein [Anaerovorax odorimutans]
MQNLQYINTTVLAYMGDAVYEVYVRKFVIESGQVHANKLHRLSVKYVKAEGQAKALKLLFDELTPNEQNLVKRARNKKITSKPKNADPIIYKLATAFEALIGYLYLSNDVKRLEDIVQKSFLMIDGGKYDGETNEK